MNWLCRPAVGLVYLKCLEYLGRLNDAFKYLDSLNHEQTNPGFLLVAARFNMSHNRPQEAAAIYEKLVRSNHIDYRDEALSGLIKSYALVNPPLAEQYEAQLPSLSLSGIDVDGLESSTSQRTFRTRAPKAVITEMVNNPANEQAKKKLKKRKRRLPKSYVPGAPIDPERWLPLRERSSFRKSRKQKNRDKELSKGASQGVTSAAAKDLDITQADKKTSSTKTSSSTSSQSSPQQSSQQQQQQKKKTNKKR